MTSKIATSKDVEITRLAYETDLYYLQTGWSVSEEMRAPVYQIVNKELAMIEGESISLADALGTLMSRTQLVHEMLEALNSGTVVAPSDGGLTH